MKGPTELNEQVKGCSIGSKYAQSKWGNCIQLKFGIVCSIWIQCKTNSADPLLLKLNLNEPVLPRKPPAKFKSITDDSTGLQSRRIAEFATYLKEQDESCHQKSLQRKMVAQMMPLLAHEMGFRAVMV
jgi:hypothetical protein